MALLSSMHSISYESEDQENEEEAQGKPSFYWGYLIFCPYFKNYEQPNVGKH
jgi:hypothetical protein